MNLPALARAVREHPGLRGKRELAAVAAVLGGDGDDAALLPDGDGQLALAAEAIHPPFVAAQPRAAGVAGVVTVLNDLAATGARPIALLDCLVAGSRRARRGGPGGPAGRGRPLRRAGARRPRDRGGGRRAGALHLRRRPRPRAAVGAQRPPGRRRDAARLPRGRDDGRGGQQLLQPPARPAPRARAPTTSPCWPTRPRPARPGRRATSRCPASPARCCSSARAPAASAARSTSTPCPSPAGLPLGRWLLTFPSFAFLLVGEPDALGAPRRRRPGSRWPASGPSTTAGVLRLRAGGRGGAGLGPRAGAPHGPAAARAA